MYQGHPWQPSKIIEELGDVLWYVTLMAELMNVPLGTSCRQTSRLERRYPDGFSPAARCKSGGEQ
ncbi:MAG: MazG nucleotide pyrophosphohydrolase domain-containing protein [Butyricicoccus sp.]